MGGRGRWGAALLVCAASVGGLLAGEAGAAAKPVVHVRLPFVAPGAKQTATGTGFRAGETVSLTLNASAVGTAKATAKGTFTATVTIPAASLSGTYTIQATGNTSHLSAKRAFAVETSWTQYRAGAARTGFDTRENLLSAANVSGLVHDFTVAARTDDVATPSDATADVYQVCNFALCSYSQSSGKRVWRSTDTQADDGAPAIGGGMIVVAEGSCFISNGNCQHLHGIDQKTGMTVWTTLIPESPDQDPLLEGSAVYYDTDTHMVAINPKTGATLWSQNGTDGYDTGPAYAPGELIAPTIHGDLDAVSTTTHKRVWRATHTDFPVTLAPIVENGAVYAGGVVPGFNGFGAWSAANGQPMWSNTNVSPTTVPGTNGAGIVYVGTEQGLVAFDATSGNVDWTDSPTALITAAPVVANGVLYYGAGTTMFAVDATTGAPLWSATDTSTIRNSPMVANGRLYWVDDNGNLVCYHQP